MNQLYSLAREMTNLTDVQIRILDHMEAALQFAADICLLYTSPSPRD